MLRENPPTAQMSDPAEFFWSKVKGEIERRGSERVVEPMPALGWADWLGQRPFAMASGAAAIIAVIAVLWMIPPGNSGGSRGTNVPPSSFARVHQVSTPIPDTDVTAFNSAEADATVIWISGLPWTADMDEMKDQFENTEI